MKIAALFTDYDGTLAPADVSRRDSAIPSPLLAVLSKISSRIPVAVITSKDFKFIKPRTPFAWAWATCMGLELRSKAGRCRRVRVSQKLVKVLTEVRRTLSPLTIVEEKRGSNGSLLGVSLDWSLVSKHPPRDVERAERSFIAKGFQVNRYIGNRYLDVYGAPTDKGVALKGLVSMLGVSGPVMYLGDSEADNGAFGACDVSVGVDHSQRMDLLRSRFFVQYKGVTEMLADFLANGLKSAGATHAWSKEDCST
jgi:trehalose-6-phosphatase